MTPTPPWGKPSIIGRDRLLIEKLAETLLDTAKKRHDYTPLRDTPRGAYFEVLIHVDGEPTGHIARVTIELDRLRTPAFLPASAPKEGS